MNRADRLRTVLPGADLMMIERLATLPTSVVADVVAAAKQAHRDGRAHEVSVRRQRKADRRKHGHVEDDQQAAATERMMEARVRRAGRSLEAARTFADFEHSIPAMKILIVAGLRAEGYSDPEIGDALGVTRQAVGQAFGRKGAFTPDGAAAGTLTEG